METAALLPAPATGPESSGMAQVVRRSFNRGFFDLPDPFDGAGIPFMGASSATSFRVDRQKQPAVLGQLFGTVYARLQASSIPDVSVKLVDYDDAWIGSEPPRRYVVVSKDTPRGTRMHLNANFRSYGDYLYVAIDAYVLPSLDVLGMLREWARMAYLIFTVLWIGGIVSAILRAVAGALSSLAFVSGGAGYGAAGFTVAGLGVGTALQLWVAGYLVYRFRNVIRSLSQGDSLAMALRRQYHRGLHVRTFDIDDVLAFYKSSALLTVDAIAEVFEANGIPTDILAQVRQTINLSTNVINNGGSLNVFGGVQGAAGNNATVAARA